MVRPDFGAKVTVMEIDALELATTGRPVPAVFRPAVEDATEDDSPLEGGGVPWFIEVEFKGLLDGLDVLRETDPDPVPAATFEDSDVVVIGIATLFVEFMTDEKGNEETVEKGSEVLMPVPALKGPDPSLIWKTPSVVEFCGPLPTSKSISFAPHCVT